MATTLAVTGVAEAISPYVPYVVWTLGGLWIVQKGIGAVSKIVGFVKNKRMLNRWSKTPKDVVIVHRFESGKTCPNVSPFVLKLETYLRMANIPYEVDETDYMSVKGKCPWITVNGEHITDSQLCIEFLAKKFGKGMGSYSKEEKAVGTLARITMDEHFYFGLILWRYVYTSGRDCHQFFDFPKTLLNILIPLVLKGKIYDACYKQGVGRHSQEDVIQIMSEDLRAISNLLGKKPFLLGSEPCEDDAAVFGQLAQIVWCCPNSPFEKLLNGELGNLKEYCLRMKSRFWPDWDEWLAPARKSKNKTK